MDGDFLMKRCGTRPGRAFARCRRAILIGLAWLCGGLISATAIAAPSFDAVVVVTAADVPTDSLARLATDAVASDGFDPGLDLFAPPPPPGDWVRASFMRPDWGQAWDEYMSDVRSPLAVGVAVKRWRVAVGSNVAADVTIRLSAHVVPAGYEIRLLDTNVSQTILVDDFTVDAYTFASSGGTREFDIEVQCLDCATGIRDDPVAVRPNRIVLYPGYPNPFNASTAVRFYLPEAVNVRLEVFNLVGRHVTTLARGDFAPGEHALTWQAADSPSGIYFVRLQAADQVLAVRAVLLK